MNIFNLLKPDQPASILQFATIFAMMGNLMTRLLVTIFGARQDLVIDGNVDPTLRKTFDRLSAGFIYIPAACLYVFGLAYAWHIARVNTVVFGGLNGIAFFWVFGRLTSSNAATWSVNHFRTQRSNWLFVDSIVLGVLLLGANSFWHYPRLFDLNLVALFLVIMNWAVSKFEIDCWQNVNVNITGKLLSSSKNSTQC